MNDLHERNSWAHKPTRIFHPRPSTSNKWHQTPTKKGSGMDLARRDQKNFDMIKEILTSENMAKPINPDNPTVLLTDASRLQGIGFTLVQEHEKGLAVIQCGSCSVTSTQQRYSAIELECMAIKWAIHKCAFYLLGLPTFQVWTDYRHFKYGQTTTPS